MTTQATISLDQLTPEQLAQLKTAMRADRKARMGDRKPWNAIVDVMLQEREGDGFKHTTADILAKLQAQKQESASLSTADRIIVIKKIQTRKQLLEKKRDESGKLLYQVGYKPSANGLMMSVDRILAYLKTASAVDQDAVHASLATLIKARKAK